MEPSPALILEESHPPAEGHLCAHPTLPCGPPVSLLRSLASDGGRGQHLRLILEKVWEGDFVFTLISINRGEGFFKQGSVDRTGDIKGTEMKKISASLYT